MEMVKVRVRNQHCINRRKIAQPQAGTAQSLEDEDPACEVGVNQDVLAAHLEEEAGVSDERHAQLTAPGQHRLASNT